MNHIVCEPRYSNAIFLNLSIDNDYKFIADEPRLRLQALQA